MNDKIVTHADLRAINLLDQPSREWSNSECALVETFVARLRAAAEADRPPLPEGWVVYTNPSGDERVLWHRDGHLSEWSDGDDDPWEWPADWVARLTPLRPTVTEADVEKAAWGIRSRLAGALALTPWANLPEKDREHYRGLASVAFTAAGVVVR